MTDESKKELEKIINSMSNDEVDQIGKFMKNIIKAMAKGTDDIKIKLIDSCLDIKDYCNNIVDKYCKQNTNELSQDLIDTIMELKDKLKSIIS